MINDRLLPFIEEQNSTFSVIRVIKAKGMNAYSSKRFYYL